MAALVDLFDSTGGPDPNSPAMLEVDPSPEFMKTFSTAQYTGANGAGPILNANAILVPNISDQYRDWTTTNDYRLNNGLGVSRAFRKPDSLGGQVDGGFQGLPYPTKNFGRDSKTPDMAWRRTDMLERARMALKKMGYKPNEVPEGSDYFPWQWNDLQALGIGSHGNQYNRNYVLPDADAVARRLYEPTPSRRTKLISTDVETAALRPNRTAMHPMKVVSEDRTREKEQRIPRNTDVIESVIYENIFPRGMGPVNNQEAVKVWADPSVLRIPVGNDDTGDRSFMRRWGNPHDTNDGAAMAASTNEDMLTLYKSDSRFVRGQDIDEETREFAESETYLNTRKVPDPNEINPYPGEFPHGQTGTSAPLVPYPSAGTVI